MPSLSQLHVGDKVQVIRGTRDQSLYGNTGVLIAKRYTTDGEIFMTITQKGLASNPSADYLVLSYGGTVITATKASFIGSNYICTHQTKPPPKETPKKKPDPVLNEKPKPVKNTLYKHLYPYVTIEDASSWEPGPSEVVYSEAVYYSVAGVQENPTYVVSFKDQKPEIPEPSPSAGKLGEPRPLTANERKETGANMIITPISKEPVFKSSLDLNTLIDGDPSKIQNTEKYPATVGAITAENRTKFTRRAYEYATEPNPRFSSSGKTLRTLLGEFRRLYGIPVHGEKAVAKYMKIHLYNRMKVPDTNLAYSKTFTHVFFTRPDCFVLDPGLQITKQCMRHSESAMLWHRNPELFKLLSDKSRTSDTHNFNLLLSNQVNSVAINPEALNVTTHGKSWHGYEMNYGTHFTGRAAGDITVGFNETKDLDIYNYIKLWATYISNVSRGAWSPRGLTSNDYREHVFTRTIDYAASMYVIKVDETGENILYWSKYYGIFPISTGSEAFGYTQGQHEGTPNLQITFKYALKRDNNPINLVEFNNNAGIESRLLQHMMPYNPDVNASTDPYVGRPYIEMLFPTIKNLRYNTVDREQQLLTLRLCFDQKGIEHPGSGMTYKTMFETSY